MKINRLKIPDVIVFEPDIHSDLRGFFFELFNQKKYVSYLGDQISFVQDNISKSKKGVLRGMHYQIPPYEQGKLVSVISGKIYDVALDIRDDSPTYGKWVGEYLSEKNKKQLWIPKGFAHGFLSLENNTTVMYKTSNFYSINHERIIKFNDKKFKIKWPLENIKIFLSNKDNL